MWKSGHVGVYIDFNPRSHEGSDLQRLVYHEIIVISIHAPTRGATLLWSLLSMLRAIFQSTLPRGERLAQQYEWDSITVISIHAPTRGATERGRRYFRTTIISIHAPTRGATPCRQKKSSMQIFQSTLPRGERRHVGRKSLQCRYFNPRSHEGSDNAVGVNSSYATRFQSTLPRGERLLRSGIRISTVRFQSTLPRGERLISCGVSSFHSDFNPRSHEGSDWFYVLFAPGCKISIHAPTRGATYG